MKNVWVWALMVCLFSSACKRKVEKELPVADTLSVVAEPVRPAELPLMPGSVTLTEDDFGPLVELSGQQKVMDEDGPLFKLSNPVARYKLDHWGKVFTDGKQFYLLCYMYDDPLFLYALPEDKSGTR